MYGLSIKAAWAEHLSALSVDPKIKSRLVLFCQLLLLLVFALAFQQEPLYSGNQNQYLLHGLANAGSGLLKFDWLAQTADSVPVFSALVTGTVRLLGENFLYLYYLVILGIYIFSVLGIVAHVFEMREARVAYLVFFVLVTVLYAGFLASVLSLSSVYWRPLPFVKHLVAPNGLVVSGVAGQYILGPTFQPSTFGVFLMLSLYFYVRDRLWLAVACLGFAATFHSTYLLSAALLTAGYMVALYLRERNLRNVALLGAFAFILVLPILVYNYTQFLAVCADAAALAQSILVDERIPQHARADVWFDAESAFQILLVVLALALVRRTKLFVVLTFVFLAAAALTLLQVLTGSKSLALMFPWRVSIFLVPLSACLILGRMLVWLVQKLGRQARKYANALTVLLWCVIVLIGIAGAHNLDALWHAPRAGQSPVVEYVSRTAQPGDIYVVPPDMQTFRLAARVPILIDWKSIPYQNNQVVEWFMRNLQVRALYANTDATACEQLKTLSAQYSVTHIVLEKNSPIANCKNLAVLARDAKLELYKIKIQ